MLCSQRFKSDGHLFRVEERGQQLVNGCSCFREFLVGAADDYLGQNGDDAHRQRAVFPGTVNFQADAVFQEPDENGARHLEGPGFPQTGFRVGGKPAFFPDPGLRHDLQHPVDGQEVLDGLPAGKLNVAAPDTEAAEEAVDHGEPGFARLILPEGVHGPGADVPFQGAEVQESFDEQFGGVDHGRGFSSMFRISRDGLWHGCGGAVGPIYWMTIRSDRR